MMNSKELLEQANSHVVIINKLMGEVEEFEGVVSEAKIGDVCFYVEGHGTTFIRVLSPEKMQEIKATVLDAITLAQKDKTAELERLLGVGPVEAKIDLLEEKIAEKLIQEEQKIKESVPVVKKAAVINPEFEAAIKKMEESTTKKKSEPEPRLLPELTVGEVKRLYLDEGKTLKDVATYFGVDKAKLNTFVYSNGLSRKQYKDDGFRDAVVEQNRKERP